MPKLLIVALAFGILGTGCANSFRSAPDTEIQPVTNAYISEIDAYITEVRVNGRTCMIINDNGITCDWSQAEFDG